MTTEIQARNWERARTANGTSDNLIDKLTVGCVTASLLGLGSFSFFTMQALLAAKLASLLATTIALAITIVVGPFALLPVAMVIAIPLLTLLVTVVSVAQSGLQLLRQPWISQANAPASTTRLQSPRQTRLGGAATTEPPQAKQLQPNEARQTTCGLTGRPT